MLCGQLGCGRGQCQRQPLEQGAGFWLDDPVAIFQPLRQLGQKHPSDLVSALVQVREQGGQLMDGAQRQRLDAEIGHLACRSVGGHALSQTPQVLDQHHAQCRRKRPQLGQAQFSRFLVSRQEPCQQRLIESAVGVGDKGPCHAIDARQAGSRRGDGRA